MPAARRLILVAKQRAFDEEQWKALLMALAYCLNEQRKAQAARQRDNKAATPSTPTMP